MGFNEFSRVAMDFRIVESEKSKVVTPAFCMHTCNPMGHDLINFRREIGIRYLDPILQVLGVVYHGFELVVAGNDRSSQKMQR